MYPILARYGPFFLYSFTVVLSIGIAAALGLAAYRARRLKVDAAWLDTFLAGLAAALISGRVGFVWLEWTYFQVRPYQILQIWRGGLTYHGALVGGLLGMWVWCAWRKRPFLWDADLLAPSLVLLNAFGWLACWLDGCGYGRIAPVGSILAANLPDNLGIYDWRYQTQLLGVGLSLLTFILILVRARRGQTFTIALLAVSVGRIGVDWLRGNTAVLIHTIRLDLLLDTALAILSLILLQYSQMQRTKSSIVKHQSKIK
ncbi:MAG: prolipoprotein diacylglyceryl transferase [Ardenticatenaceae bacterium]|nr:prolipoprotein diacylglyceryl transferase [Ardenticatenaceae bacterium]